MTGSVEGGKDVGTDKPAEGKEAGAAPAPATAKAAAASAKPATKPSAKSSTPFAAALAKLPPVRIDPRMAAVATVALAVGTGFGMLSAPRGRSSESLVRIEAGLEAGRTEASRLNTEIEHLSRTLSALRETSEAARGESRSLGASLAERLTRMEQGLDRRIAALAEKPVSSEREAGTPLAAATPVQPEKRAATPAAAAVPTTPMAATMAATATTARPEPTQTASIPEAKPKSETVEGWALRDVYDGVAMLEDRKRRLVEVAPGESVPGVGRVEAIERRGRTWVVVTRQGLITPQMW